MSPSKITPVYAGTLAEMHKHAFDEPWSVQSFKELLALPTTLGWVSADGFILCSVVFDEMEILTICTMPEKRRHGIATQFLNEAQRYALVHSIEHIFLEVSVQNAPAIALYKKFGFIQTGLRKRYYKIKDKLVDALCMTKTI